MSTFKLNTMNVFELLNDIDVCYAVAVSKVNLKLNSSICDREYFVMVSKNDEGRIQELNYQLEKYNKKPYPFNINRASHDKTMEHTLNRKEVEFFKNMTTSGDMIRVIHTEEGRVYELKGKSFKEYVS